MAIYERTYEDLLRDSMATLVQQTRITKVSAGGKARAIMEAVDRQINRAYKTFDINLARAFVSGANGRYLDLIGEVLGVSRAGTETARASAATRTVRFFVDTGNFGTINGGVGFTIPRDTRISSSAGNTGTVYRLVTPLVVASTATEGFAAVEAVSAGTAANIGPGTLRFHDFRNYTDIANDSLKVSNVAGIYTGADVENDTNYRFRISKQTLAAEAANETAIRLAALLVPGVADVLTLRFFKGIGTYRIVVKSITPSVPASLLEAVLAAIENVTALGILAEAQRPLESGLAFEITVRYRKTLPEAERGNVEEGIRTALTDYVNALDIGEAFIINEAVERVMSVSQDILDIGKPGKPFDRISLYKETKLRDNKLKEELLKNYTPVSFERVIIEPSLSQPITISTGSA